jgi:hypothetical protein
MTSIALTQDSVRNTKRVLTDEFPNHKSSHLTEALAVACGYRTHAALLSDLASSSTNDPEFVLLNDVAFANRLQELSGESEDITKVFESFEVLCDLSMPNVVRTTPKRGHAPEFKTQRDRAWRNVMVAAINAGIDQRLFTIKPGDNRWPNAKNYRRDGSSDAYTYSFSVNGIPGIASVSDAGWDELSIKSALWPTAESGKWITAVNAGFAAGDTHAHGWLERRDGAWLQFVSSKSLHCRRARLQTVCEIDIRPKGFADRGTFKM